MFITSATISSFEHKMQVKSPGSILFGNQNQLSIPKFVC